MSLPAVDLSVSRDLAIGLFVLWLLLIFSAIGLALRRARRGGVGLSTTLSIEECARRLAAHDAEQRPDRWIAATISARVRGARIRIVHRPQGALTSLLLIRFLLPLYLLRSNPFAPVIYDGRMARTAVGTSIDGRFRMNRFAYIVAVWFIAGSIVTVIGFLAPWGGIWQWPWDVPEVAASFLGSVALLVVSAVVVGASRYAGASSRTEVLSYLLRELDAHAVELAQSP